MEKTFEVRMLTTLGEYSMGKFDNLEEAQQTINEAYSKGFKFGTFKIVIGIK